MKNIKKLLAATSIAFTLLVAAASTTQAQSIVVRTGPPVHHRYHHPYYHHTAYHRHYYHHPYHRPYHRY